VSDGGFLRGPTPAHSSSYSGGGVNQSRADEPTQSPQQRAEDTARADLVRANQLAAAATKLDQAPADQWQDQRDQLAAKVEAFAASLHSSAHAAPSADADRDRAATAGAIAAARTTLHQAKPPRRVSPVAGELELEPRIADKSIAPEEVIDWMAGLSKSEREAVWRRYGTALGNRADTFAVALSNYVSRHRDRTPPLSTDLRALATMSPQKFARWRANRDELAATSQSLDAPSHDAPETHESYAGIGGTVDPVAASAQLGVGSGSGSGTVDDPMIGWRDLKRAALSGPFTTAPREVQSVLGGPLLDQLRKRETIHFLMDPTGSDLVKAGIADVLGDLANDPEFTIGFAEGAITGTGRAIYDTVKGFVDTGKLAQELIIKFATFQYRDLMRRGKKEVDALIEVVHAAPGILAGFAKHWTATDSYTRGEFQGEAIAYILTQLAIIIAGSLTGGPAMAGPFANVIKVLGWIDNPIAGLTEVAAGARLSTAALEALHAGQGIRSIEPIAEVRAASHAFGAVDDAATDLAATRRPMATADLLARDGQASSHPLHGPSPSEATARPHAERAPDDATGGLRDLESPALDASRLESTGDAIADIGGTEPTIGKDPPYRARDALDALDAKHPGDVTPGTVLRRNEKNAKLAGKRHPVTGIVFDERGFSIFDDVAVFETRLPDEATAIVDRDVHMRAATRQLDEAIARVEVSASIFNDQQMAAIRAHEIRIPGLTWHHHQELGRMQLVPTQIHNDTGHKGGFRIWYSP